MPDQEHEVPKPKAPRKRRKKTHEGNGQHEAPVAPMPCPSQARQEPDPTPLRVRERNELVTEAESWARECGLEGDLDVSEPQAVLYPVCGHGYWLTVRERAGKARMATARFTGARERAYWSVDGLPQ